MLSERTAIETMYIHGHLGGGTIAKKRLAAGLRFISDLRKSEERCKSISEECSKFAVYLDHFLKKEDNVGSFIEKHPKTRGGKKRTCEDVYMAVMAMLDKIDTYYQRRRFEWTD